MAKKTAYRGGMVPNVARTVSPMTTMKTVITAVHMTEVRRASMGGTVLTVQCTVCLTIMTQQAITPVTSTVTKSVWTDTDLQIVKNVCWVDTGQTVH